MMPSAMFIAKPSGCTSTSFTIRSGLDRPLVLRSRKRRCATTIVSAERGDRVVRIIRELIGPRLAFRRGRRQCPAAREIPRCESRPRQRPGWSLVPLIEAHKEDLDRRLAIDAVVDALEVVVVPAE